MSKKQQTPGDGDGVEEVRREASHDSTKDNELVPIKVRRGTYRLVKLAATWLDITALEYLDQIAKEAVARDLVFMKTELEADMKKRREADGQK